MTSMAGKSIIVSGGASGIGQATALLLAQAGCSVTIADLSEEGNATTVRLIEEAGGRAHAVRTDITLEDDVKASVDAAMSAYGRLDGACNAAGVPTCSKTVEEMSLAEWQRGISIMLTGAFLSLKYQIPAIMKSGGGSIVVIGSAASVIGYPASSEYCAAKSGILGLVRSTSCDYASKGIRINAVLPGGTRTPLFNKAMEDTGLEDYMIAQHPIGRLAEPREIGVAIRWLLSDESSFVTGSAMAVDGGSISI